ncbi:glyoxylase-like metal-dependent hydrolase (beta-lactamase superfamily II) [Rhizobium sp. PP-F2F-G48]|uniref:MBL fold metallo-hydrolase n=1 Tax=Rhizobium sp. PP-F2F-G48 TaxID=2135651 RepID=UPI001046585C|nr:MBL fold metallo-hydrolase [Rhizobium sp. PP-F2F-G48]TCM55918.1 glyoxylase-like metal-dependent hydrolase (beta-lactamase superfamily II) [Rhizobium sp. PP-F2F-G48]
MHGFTLGRRALFAATALGALAAPLIMKRAAFAQGAAGAAGKETPKASTGGKSASVKLGDVTVTVVSDGLRIADKPNETFGTDQPPEAVKALLEKNFLPTDRFANGFSPVVVDTGSEVVLFDTGNGEAGRPAGTGYLLEGLRAAGYPPESITLVVLTHMHGDHINGLMEGGKPAFPNARYVMGETELAFWKDPARIGTPAEGGHKAVLKNVVPLVEKAKLIGDGADVASGIMAMAAFGHSPGHMVFRISSQGKDLMLTADTANHYVFSLQQPDWQVKFDMDKEKAAASRRKVFDMIATERLPFIGYHMPFPAVGYVEKQDAGYRFVPASYQLYL